MGKQMASFIDRRDTLLLRNQFGDLLDHVPYTLGYNWGNVLCVVFGVSLREIGV